MTTLILSPVSWPVTAFSNPRDNRAFAKSKFKRRAIPRRIEFRAVAQCACIMNPDFVALLDSHKPLLEIVPESQSFQPAKAKHVPPALVNHKRAISRF